MDPVTAILVPSILGGVAIAWVIGRLHGRGPYTVTDVRLERVSTDVINIAHIRAAGLGGLGLFAMALVVAWFVPAIRLAVSAGVVLGALLGAVLIFRRRTGPLPSSGGGAGANLILSIDRPAASGNEDAVKSSNQLRVAQPAGGAV
jgi:hypothetical protein